MTSLISFAATAICFTTGSAMRSTHNAPPNPLLDMTEYFHELVARQVTSKSGRAMQCCCDAPSSNFVLGFFNHTTGYTAEYTFRCIVGGAKGCSKLKAGWHGERALRHSSEIKDGRCMVHTDDVPFLFKTFGSPRKYCLQGSALVDRILKATARILPHIGPERNEAEPLVADASLGASSPVQCPAGYVAEVPTVTCTYKSPTGGVFDPAPTCVKVETWCVGFDTTADDMWRGLPWVPSSEVNLPVDVHCAPGFSPFPPRIFCGKDQKLTPMPVCALTDNYCRNTAGENASGVNHAVVDEDAKLGEWQPVRCLKPGEIPVDEYVQCGNRPDFSGGMWQPEPSCITDFVHCPSVVASSVGYVAGKEAHVQEAALGRSMAVDCRAGSRPNVKYVTCHEDGEFYGPNGEKPSCSPVADWCAAIATWADEAYVYAPAAARGKLSEVECTPGFKAVPQYLSCERNRQFDAQPTCVKIGA